jgi:hypothetical protein
LKNVGKGGAGAGDNDDHKNVMMGMKIMKIM